METPARRGKIAILAVLGVDTVAGLGLRLGYALEQPAAATRRRRLRAHRPEPLPSRLLRRPPPGVSREVQPAGSYAPGLPLFVAGLYELSGGVHLTFALVVLALFGAGTIPLTFLLGKRMAGPVAGLIGAGAFAGYPALLQYQGLLLTEPLAAFLLSAALVTFLHAADWPSPWRWLGAGALLGALSLVRPEYLAIAVLLPLTWLVREGLCGRLRRSAALAGVSLLGTILVLAPWTIRNAIVLDRAVPISTGGGKALFIGTYLDAHGDGPKLRELLLSERPGLRRRFLRGGPVDDPNRFVLERVLARVAAERYPGLETDAALGRMGRQNLEDDIAREPIAFAGMLVDKAYESWTDSARAVMEREPWRVLQLGLIAWPSSASWSSPSAATSRRGPRPRPGVHDGGQRAADLLAPARARCPAHPRRTCRDGSDGMRR